jgi:centromere protein C
MGYLGLPPNSIKHPESVGYSALTFTVGRCQPGSIELAISHPKDKGPFKDPMTAQRFLLEESDVFRIPPGNSYRIQNHSKTTVGFLTWTSIEPSD